MKELTVNDFIKTLQSLKPSLRELPLVIITPNGMEVEPKCKRLIEGKHSTMFDDSTKMILTY